MDLKLGVKIYDNDWFIRHKLSAAETADLLEAWGVTYVIAQSKFLPMQDSAVASAVSQSDLAAYHALSDVGFREELKRRGISYFACLNICFDPKFFAAHRQLAPIDQFGNPMQPQDWYVGITPICEENLAHKIELLKVGVAELKPEAIHLGFMRWPGFWETWLPGDRRADKPEYSFDRDTVRRFREETGIATAMPDDPRSAAEVILTRHRAEWTRWKCRQTVATIGRIRKELEPIRGGLQYSINTLPFFKDDFEGAVEEVFGQDFEMLAEVVDVFEVMAYHQILARPADWPAKVASDIRQRSGRQAICTVQASPLYLEGMHRGRGRQPTLPPEEFASALQAIADSPVDGACIFTFSDLLNGRGTAEGQAMIDALKSFRA